MFVKCLVLIHIFIAVVECTDFYDLLGISRDASKADIRRAFKKIALEKHPDKNTQDPNAHETFTKINKAYETLKDDELRKKYDSYGEEGLKDDHFSNQYQSWNFYNEQFGIYDDDPEIITLSYSDFEQSVSGTNDIWFINFYSPHCSHCHTLAPTWRGVAKELNGVVRMGAVNCQDDWSLCNMQGIRSYPSLRVYPTGEYYYGEHDREEIVKYLLNFLNIEKINLNMKYVKNEFKKHNFVISFCDPEEENCASEWTILKLTAMLENLVKVVQVDCKTQHKVCEHFETKEGIKFYPVGCKDQKCEKSISSFDATEITEEVLGLLPQPATIDSKQFDKIDLDVYEGRSTPWVLIFLQMGDEKNINIEIVKMTGLIPDANIGSINCKQSKDLCDKFHVTKHPTVVLYKRRGYEYHYGRYTAHDVALFAKDSTESNVIALEPKHFPVVTQDTEHNWFIDFFTPWCPPCLKLLPEWRKAGKQIGDRIAYFGTLDCTIHKSICQSNNINSYPTTIFYNKSEPHVFTGYHTVEEIINFAEDVLNPPVVKLTPETFESLVSKKAAGETWLVDFYAPWCGPCMELAPTYRELAKKLNGEAKLGDIDCQQHHYFCQQQNVNSYPTIRLYPYNSHGTSHYVRHQGWRDLDSLYSWVFQNFPSSVEVLDDHTFYNGVLNSKDAYIIDFYAPWCGHCHVFAPQFEKLAKRLEGKIKAAKVDCDRYRGLCRQAGVRQYPSVKLYVGSSSDDFSQSIQGESIDNLDDEYIEIVALRTLEQHKEIMSSESKIVHDEM